MNLTAAHRIGDDCPGGHYADPGSDGSCCQAAQATDGDRHAWNCRTRYAPGVLEENDPESD